jgi:hypothetical protein
VPGVGREYRVVTTPDHVVTGCDNDTRVWGAAVQFLDGSIDAAGVEEEPHVWVETSPSSGLTTNEARELAAHIVQVAEQIDGWAGR